MKVQITLIWDLMLYEFELGHDAAEATKNICLEKSEGVVNSWLKAFRFGCKIRITQARSGRSKTVDSETFLHPIECYINSVTHTLVWLASFTLSAKKSRAAELHLKILQNFWLSLITFMFLRFKSWGNYFHGCCCCLLIAVYMTPFLFFGPISWGCWIHRLHLCSGVTSPQWLSCGPVGMGC